MPLAAGSDVPVDCFDEQAGIGFHTGDYNTHYSL